MWGRTGRPGDEQHIRRLDLRDAPQHHLSAVHLAHLFAEEALSVGHHQAGVAGRLVDYVLLGIVDLIGDIEQAQVVRGDGAVGGNDLALAVLLRIRDADSVVDLVVEADSVVDDRLVIDEVITTC